MYHAIIPFAIVATATIKAVRAGWRSGCTIILMYTAKPSTRVIKTTIAIKLYVFAMIYN